VEARGARVDVVVNHDHFRIRPELMDDDTARVQGLTGRFYARGPRYAASGFLQARLERGSNRKPITQRIHQAGAPTSARHRR